MTGNGLEILTAAMVEEVLNANVGSSQKILKVKGQPHVWNIGPHNHAEAAEVLEISRPDIGLPGKIAPDYYQLGRRRIVQGIVLTKAGASFGAIRPEITKTEEDAVVEILTLLLKECGRKGEVRLDTVVL